MRLSKEISTWSKDPSSQIGVVIVNDERRILSTGYNGFPRGIEDTEERLYNKEEKYPRIVHAELNALLGALYNGVSVKGAILYVYGLPVCADCTKSVIQAGIKRVAVNMSALDNEKWTKQWNEISKPMFQEAGVSLSYLNTEHWSFDNGK